MKTTFLSGVSLFLLLRFCSGLAVKQNEVEEGKLVFASILYRHGERTPERPYAKDPYKDLSHWPTDWGMLTNNGKNQHYELGKWLRKRYTSLIPGGKYSNNLVYVQSTDWERTIMSAQSNLAGMFYPTQEEMWSDLHWQPVPVHVVPRELDKVLNVEYPCPKYKKEEEALKQTSMFKDYTAQHQKLYKYLTENTGEPVDEPAKVRTLFITLYIQELKKFPLPAWTKSVYPEQMNEVGTFSFRADTMTKTMKRFRSGLLLKEIITHMKQKKSGTLIPNRNLWIYSAHDTTVASLLDTMGVFEPHMPPFAATVLVELRRNSKDQFLVSVHYKNSTEEPTLLTIPGCTPYCPLEKFQSLMSPFFPEDKEKECRAT